MAVLVVAVAIVGTVVDVHILQGYGPPSPESTFVQSPRPLRPATDLWLIGPDSLSLGAISPHQSLPARLVSLTTEKASRITRRSSSRPSVSYLRRVPAWCRVVVVRTASHSVISR